ncbi:hypothetical protein [Bdellovibrio sp. HCB337]|uniref:hypothetical protein n=1 Tax=Bdellovibrio sp. HCB337 TaxID=3394358 RepID=UPI0039A61490
MKRSFTEEYLKHTALNLGQLARDFRYFYYHPDADKVAKEGSLRHYVYSSGRRVKSMGNNLFYSVIPPHWHHTAEDLMTMPAGSMKEWFLHGYAPWEYCDPTRK